MVEILDVYFFFSSRRRHTRYIGDWSSDVCSSDLARQVTMLLWWRFYTAILLTVFGVYALVRSVGYHAAVQLFKIGWGRGKRREERSEERRVGKECRCRWGPFDEKKKD